MMKAISEFYVKIIHPIKDSSSFLMAMEQVLIGEYHDDTRCLLNTIE